MPEATKLELPRTVTMLERRGTEKFCFASCTCPPYKDIPTDCWLRALDPLQMLNGTVLVSSGLSGCLPARTVVLGNAVAGLCDDPINLKVPFALPHHPVTILARVIPVVRLVAKLVACLLVAIEAATQRSLVRRSIVQVNILTAPVCSLGQASKDRGTRISTCSSP